MKKKNLICIILCMAMALGLFASCSEPSSTENSTQQVSTAASTDSQSEEIVEITMLHWLNPEIQFDDNAVLDLIEEELGIRLIIEAPPSNDFWDRLNIKMATGDMPDFILTGTDVNFEKWSSEGLLADITDDIENYPNLVSNISEEQWGDTTALHDGKIYGVPRANDYDKWGMIVNKEWLDALDLQAPKTIDDFIEVCTAFTFDDPDGNGQNDTFGASFDVNNEGGIWALHNDFLNTAYGISLHHGMPDVNGEYNIKQLSAEYYDYMELMNTLYADGIIDREFITHKNDEHLEKMAQERVGIIGISSKNYMTDFIEKYNLDPNKYEYCAPLVRDESRNPIYALPPSNWCAFAINSQTDKKDDILRLLDWANGEEGFLATHIGVEGEHYNSYDVEARTIDRTDEQATEAQKVAGNMFGFANSYMGRPLFEGAASPENTAIWRENTTRVNDTVDNMYMPFVKSFFAMAGEFPDESQGLATTEVRYITGEATLEDLETVVNEYGETVSSYIDIYKAFMSENPAQVK